MAHMWGLLRDSHMALDGLRESVCALWRPSEGEAAKPNYEYASRAE
jgi:hypothetical protein